MRPPRTAAALWLLALASALGGSAVTLALDGHAGWLPLALAGAGVVIVTEAAYRAGGR